MADKKAIYCPSCWRKLATYDGQSHMNIEIRCKRCNIYLRYTPEDNQVKVIQNPERTTGSGKRFY